MPVEQARYISELDASRPQGSESLSEADDHHRLVKSCLQNTLVGNASDPFDTPLRVGPRALNSLSDTLNLSSFVTLTGTQSISGNKTFTTAVQTNVGITGDTAQNLIARWNNTTLVGNTVEATYLTSPDKNGFGVLYGQTAATIVHTGNLAEHVVNVIYPIGAVLFSTTGSNPSSWLVGTSWERIAEGRYIVGEGVNTDAGGNTRTMVAGNRDQGRYAQTLDPAQMPSHAHGLATVNDAGGNITYDGPRHRFVSTGGAFAQGATEYSGSNDLIENEVPSYVMFTWRRVS